MRTIHLKRSSVASSGSIRKTIRDAARILAKFGTQRVIEEKLAPSSLIYEFNFWGSSREATKSTDKLSTLLRRALMKHAPYIDLSVEDYFKKASGEIHINLCSPYFSVDSGEKSRIVDASLTTHWVKSLERYVKYLQFLCIKHKVPVLITCSHAPEFSAESVERITKMTVSQMTDPGASSHMTYRILGVIQILPVIWTPLDRPGLVVGSFDNMQEYIDALVRAYGESLAFSRENWQSKRPWLSSFPLKKFLPGMEEYLAVEKIFLHLKDAIKVMRTLSRKTTYAAEAFCIGAHQSPSN